MWGRARVCVPVRSETGVVVYYTCLCDTKGLYSTGTRDRGQARVCAVENRLYSSKGRSYPKGRVCPRYHR